MIGDGFYELSQLLYWRQEWRYSSTKTPEGHDVLIAPSGTNFGILEDRKRVRNALKAGSLSAFTPMAFGGDLIEAGLWAHDWAWNEILLNRSLGAKTQEDAVFAFKPIVRSSAFDAVFPTEPPPATPAFVIAAREQFAAELKAREANVSSSEPPEAMPSSTSLPPYVAFMVWVCREIDATRRQFHKGDLSAWLLTHWPNELLVKSDRKAKGMAMFLGDPHDEKGGRQERSPLPENARNSCPMLSSVQAAPDEIFPPYLRFMLDFSQTHDLHQRLKKTVLQEELENKWPQSLGPRTSEKIELMAMLLRSPEHEKGGFIPASRISKASSVHR